MTLQEVQSIIAEADKNGDGRLDYAEVNTLYVYDTLRNIHDILHNIYGLLCNIDDQPNICVHCTFVLSFC